MKFWKAVLAVLAALLLLTLYQWFFGDLRALFEDKVEANPINPLTTAFVFGGTEKEGPVWVVTDAKVIARLQRSYRWTNKHMICCLEGTVDGYVDYYEGNRYPMTDLRHKLYAEGNVPAFNAAFRRELSAARKNAVPMYRTVGWTDAPVCAAEVEAALPGCIVAVGNYRTLQGLEMHILTPQPLTAEEITLLRQLDGVRIP